ncbi:hypothetical protein [Sulfolobus sp. S-194]|uniref:hypothetical protein n=1 Tax=Sulfolobus sp. S-194 TaxID=2512240 RepID=UPI00143A5ECA|nr:hypothetical protein [Sulfolobus sp. S-194]
MTDKICIKPDLSIEIGGEECFTVVEVEMEKESSLLKIKFLERDLEYIGMVVRNDTKG